MAALQFPYTIFRTQNFMDDYGASDMRYGDLSERELLTRYQMDDVSAKVNPFTLIKSSASSQPAFYNDHDWDKDVKVTHRECVTILFDELRHLSKQFALIGPYTPLISQMITHMQRNNGAPFSSILLDAALKEQIINDYTENSTLLKIKEVLNTKINWSENFYPENEEKEFRKGISRCILPKFDRFCDKYNGMAITVHDTYATYITIKSLDIANGRYRAVVHYKIQDHFGLDSNDILQRKYHQFRFFRLWFVLQRYNQLGFKPFMTNMEATVEITGEYNEY